MNNYKLLDTLSDVELLQLQGIMSSNVASDSEVELAELLDNFHSIELELLNRGFGEGIKLLQDQAA